MKIALVVNPCSGRNRPGTLLPKVQKQLTETGVAPRVFLSENSAHIRALGAALDVRAYDAVASMGGDGTNFHLINGLLDARTPGELPPLGIIPAGSGNSFTRDLGIVTPEQAVQAIAGMKTRPVDLIQYTGGKDRFFFVNLMGLGFVTEVAITAHRHKRLNDLAYLVGVARQTLSLSCDAMEIRVDDKRFSGQFCFVEFCNSRYTGGRMLMAPGARIDDGLMDVVMVRALTRKRLITSLPRIYAGTHMRMPETCLVRGRTAHIAVPSGPGRLLPDGEITGTAPGTVEVLPQQLRYLVCAP